MAQAGIGNLGSGLGKFTELRQRLLFVLGALVVYRIGCFVPVPGVNPDAMLAMMQAQGGGIVDMFNMFSGGALHRFSIFALNVMPYISASIVMQLGVHIFPSLKALQKEGESGRRKITQYSRIGAVLLAVVQGGSIATALQNQVAPGGMPVVYAPGMGFVLTAVVSLTAGTMFLMWLGEQVTERGIGNGVSLIIFAGIVAGLPSAVISTVEAARNGDMSPIAVIVIALLVVAFTYFVVFVERGQRRITVNYARRQGGRNAYMNQSSFLPLKLNMAGVIPAIFASSIIMFPATASTWFSQAGQANWLQRVSQALSPGVAFRQAGQYRIPLSRLDPAREAHVDAVVGTVLDGQATPVGVVASRHPQHRFDETAGTGFVAARARAQPSAASASARLCTGPASCCRNTLSMTAAMLAKFSRPARKAATATSFAAFMTAGIVPPARAASWAIARHGNLSKSGSSKDNLPICTRSRTGTPDAMRSGQPSACAIGTRMSGWLICASTEPSSNSTSEWTMLCGWMTT